MKKTRNYLTIIESLCFTILWMFIVTALQCSVTILPKAAISVLKLMRKEIETHNSKISLFSVVK